MLLWMIAALYILGLLTNQILSIRYRRSKQLHPRISYWVVFFFVTLVSLVLYFNQVPIGAFFENLSTVKVIGVFLCILLLLVLFELSSPMNLVRRAFRKDRKGLQEEEEAVFSEGEYERVLRLIVGLVALFLILTAPLSWGLERAGAAQERAGLLCIIGVLMVVLLPVCIRQIVYYLIRIKRLQPDLPMNRSDKSYEIVDGYLRHKNRKL